MPQRNLELQEKQVQQQLRKNTLIATVCTIAGFSLLFPAFSIEGTKFDYQEFCFKPPSVPAYVTWCKGKRLKKGIAWKVALEASTNQEFQSKVKFLKFLPAQNPNASLYGLCAAASFLSAFLVFKGGTDQLEDNLDLVVWNKKSLVLERVLQNNQHMNIETMRNEQEQEFLKDIMQRDHGDAMYSLMSEIERELAANQHHKGSQLEDAGFDLQMATMSAQSAEQQEKEAKHKIEVQKLNHRNSEATKTLTLESMLKEHEAGWLWTLAKGKMPIIIYGKQGAYKSYTAACLALLKAHFQEAKIVNISDSHAHQNRDEAWKELITFEPELYGSNENWDEYADSIDAACERWANRTLKDAPIISIWDELTTMGIEIPDKAKVLMPKVISSPRKANENVICITHSLTNAGLGGIEGMSEAIKEGTLRLKLKADSFQEPLFKGDLSGWVDELGNELSEMPVTLPPWFRPAKLVDMFRV